MVALLTFLTYRTVLSTFAKEEFGSFFLAQQLGTLVLTCLVEAGMTTVVVGMAAREPARADVIIATLAKLRFGLWCVASPLLMVIGLAYGANTPPLLALWALHSLLGARAQLLRGALEIRRKALSDQLPSSLAAVLDALLLFALVWLDRRYLSSLSLLLWFTLAVAPGFVWLLLLDKNWKTLALPFDRTLARRMIRLSFPVFIVVVMQQTHGALDAVLLDYFCSKSEVAVYGAAFRLMSQAFIFVVAFAGALFPTITRLSVENEERCRAALLDAVRVAMIAGAAFALFASALLHPLIYLSSGEAYAENAKEFWLFGWAVAYGFPQVLLLTLTTAIHWQRRNYLVFGVMLAVSAVGTLALAPRYQAFGAIVSKALSFAASSALSFKILADYSGKRAVWRLARQSALALGAGAGISWILLQYCSPLSSFLLTIPIFVAIITATGLAGERERRWLAEQTRAIARRIRRRGNRPEEES